MNLKKSIILAIAIMSLQSTANAQGVIERFKNWYNGPAAASCTYDSIQTVLPCIRGQFKGFGPTDESPIAMGELELTISDSKIVYRMATGLKIETAELALADLRIMTQAELASLFKQGSNPESKVFGLIRNDGSYPKIIINKVAGDSDDVIMFQGQMFDIRSPAILFSPGQVKKGLFDKKVEEVLKQSKFPQLKYNGKMQ